MQTILFFSLCYMLFSVCFVFPPPEFISVGLTIESIFSPWLKNESDSFIRYHMRRTVAAYLTHCFIPIFYVLGMNYFSPVPLLLAGHLAIDIAMAICFFIPCMGFMNVFRWCRPDWSKHPVSKNLRCFITGDCTIEDVAKNIDDEYRSVNKIIIKCGALTRVVVTDNWIIKIAPYTLNIAHQSDTTVVVSSSDSHLYVPDMPEGGQYLNIDVKSTRANTHSFQIRLNSSDFKDLQERMVRPVSILANVVVHGSLTDCFLKVFRDNIKKNPKIAAPENLDVCIGCFAEKPNVKILTSCGDTTGPNKCTMCYCKPLWCENCMGKWFASRQDQDKPESWLSSKCSCPMCRSTFCILDICPLVSGTNEPNED